MYGPHLMLDCSQCNREKLDDLDFVFFVLDQLPNLIGMTKITVPYVFHYSGVVPEERGITGVVIIAESHISIHTYPEKDYFFCDVFSCKPFDTELATQFILDGFEAKECKIHHIQRGKDFPR